MVRGRVQEEEEELGVCKDTQGDKWASGEMLEAPSKGRTKTVISAVKLDEIGLSGKESDVESLHMSHRIRLLRRQVQNLYGQNHQSRHRDWQGVDQKVSPPLWCFYLYVGRVWSNHYNLNIS